MSSPSNSQPSQAAAPDFHCSGDRSRRLRTSRRLGTETIGSGTGGAVSDGSMGHFRLFQPAREPVQCSLSLLTRYRVPDLGDQDTQVLALARHLESLLRLGNGDLRPLVGTVA